MKIEPRRARVEEWPDVAAVFAAARAAMPYLPDLHTAAETRAFIADVVARQEVWVMEAPTSRGGAAIAAFAAIRDTQAVETWLDHLYVHPAVQNHALGSALLERVKTQRPDGFSLFTFQANAGARRFYERHGLTLAKLGDGRDNEEGLPDALYLWRGPEGGGSKSE